MLMFHERICRPSSLYTPKLVYTEFDNHVGLVIGGISVQFLLRCNADVRNDVDCHYSGSSFRNT